MPLFKSKAAPPLTKKDISAPFNPVSLEKDLTKSWLRINPSNKTILGLNGAEVIRSRGDLFDPEDVVTSAVVPSYSDVTGKTKPPQRRTNQACPKTYKPDEFYQLDSVVSLNKDNIKDFIKGKDTVMITFYDPCVEECRYGRQMLREVITDSDKVMSFGAVNCKENFGLCRDENALNVPLHKIYFDGKYQNSLKFLEMLNLISLHKKWANKPKVQKK